MLALIPILIVACSAAPSEAQRENVLIVKMNTEITGATSIMIQDALGIASNLGARLIVMETNTPGGEVNAVREIIGIFETSPIPFCVFVYPPGASAWSGGTYLLMASDVAAMASGTSIGSAQPVAATGEPISDPKIVNALTALMVNNAGLHDRNETAARMFVVENLNLGPEEALRFGSIEIVADDVPTLLGRLAGMTLIKVESETGTSLWKLVPSEEAGGYPAVVEFNFAGIDEAEVIEYRPGIRTWLLDIIFNPVVASLTFILGFFLLLIGIQTPGFGSELVGGVLLVLSLLSLQVIGIEPVIIFFFALGFGLIIAELKTNIGILGIAGVACVLLGSFLFFPSPQWLLAPEIAIQIRNTLLLASSVLSVFFGFLLYKVARARGLEVRTGSEAIGGSSGVAVTRLAPLGEVRVGGEAWRARAEGGEIERGARIVVVGREGLLLVVREAGAADSTQQGSPSKRGESE